MERLGYGRAHDLQVQIVTKNVMTYPVLSLTPTKQARNDPPFPTELHCFVKVQRTSTHDHGRPIPLTQEEEKEATLKARKYWDLGCCVHISLHLNVSRFG